MILILFIIVTFLNTKIVLSGNLTVLRRKSFSLNYTSYLNHKHRYLMCISDSPKDAIVWNTHLNWINKNFIDTEYTYASELSNSPRDREQQCRIDVDSSNCSPKWGQHHGNWSKTYSFDVPMGPVYDSRWEYFPEYKSIDYTPIRTYKYEIQSTLTFGETGALVFSIRGSKDAQLLLCESNNFSDNFCYWVIIGGWNNTNTIMRKCENGVPKTWPPENSDCWVKQAEILHNPLSPYKWETFVLTWEEKNRTLKLFHLDKMILSYSDRGYNSTGNSTKSYHIFYRNRDTEMRFRFHDYPYNLTTQPGATLKSQPLIIGNSQEICIDMLVGLCKQCQLDVSVIDGSGKRRITKTITRSLVYENIEHNLPMWQNEKVQLSNILDYPPPITLELVAVLSSENTTEIGNHWAITKFEECLPKGTVKRMLMLTSQDFWDGYFWPKVTCQKLSYDHRNSEVVDSSRIVTEPPNDLQYCSNYTVGPYCATSCLNYCRNDCYSTGICKENGCFCPQGFENGDAGECTSDCLPGSYGYGCTKKCSNCQSEKCNRFTGKCDNGCKQIPDQFLVPPYCNIVIKLPAALYFDHIKKTSVWAFYYEEENYRKINATFQFEIKKSSSNDNVQIVNGTLDSTNNTLRKIYYVFKDLTPGMNYSVRAMINIQFDTNKHKQIKGNFATFITLCNWSEWFKIFPDKRSLLIQKISEEVTDPCPDFWYSIQLSKITSTINELQPINIDNVEKKFPIIFQKLNPFTEYKVCISGNNKFHKCQNVLTLEAAPSPVLNLQAKSITNTEAEITWDSPNTPNGNLTSYNLTIKVLYYKGCKTKEDTPTYLITSKSFSNITPNRTVSYKITDLVPYVSYEVTVVAHNSIKGNESKIIFNTTENDIPTEVFSNVTFSKNKISWIDPVDCWMITGNITHAKVFLFGISENVKDFSDEHITQCQSFTLNDTKTQKIYGNEKYKIRIHVLHKHQEAFNKTAFSELPFITDPSPPPKVQNLELIEVDEKTTTLRWQEPFPPTNGEIIYYTIRFMEKHSKLQNDIKVYPNDTCYLWTGSLCKTVVHPSNKAQYIEVIAYNKGVNDPGKGTKIKDNREEQDPKAPNITCIQEKNNGTVYLKWQHPNITGGRIKKFIIHRNIISTELEQSLSIEDKTIIEFPILNYEKEYDTHLHLLPSTHYNISVQAMTQNKSGQLSNREIETNSSLAFANFPHPIPINETFLINIVIPPVINNTKGSKLNIIVKGPLACTQGGSLSNQLRKDVGLEYHEVAWRVATLLTSEKANHSFIIGDEHLYDGVSNCPLYVGSSYVIFIVVHEKNRPNNRTKPQTIIWKSEPIPIGPIPKKHHESWAIPLVLLFVVIGGISYYYLKKRDKKYFRQKRSDEMSEPIPIHPVPFENKKIKSHEHVNKDLDVADTINIRESILITPSNSMKRLNRITTESIYENLKCNSLIKINEFQDYVKQAVASGKLDQQYEMFRRGQTKPWKYGTLIQNKSKNRYGNLIAYDDTRVVLEKLPDDPYSDYINANFIKGYNNDKAYIATQGPKPNTLIDFWRMIWQEEVQVICMLANVIEGGKTKCEQYWPEIGRKIKFGKITVANISHTVFADYSLRTFNATFDQTSRKIYQLHFTAWPDHGIPFYTQSVVSYLRKLLARPAGNGPILVHCSAGVGRTGTIIVCDICLRRAAAKGVIDVFGETEMIRNQRANMVDNKQQYLLAHLVLVECLLALPTTIPCNDNLPVKIQEFKNQLVLQHQALEESTWQDRALQPAVISFKLSETNLAKNRFPDLAPVAPQLYIARYPSSEDDSNYITGVYVDSARRKNNYIASQLPLPNTVGDFWRMVAEFKVELIILLQPVDPNDETCGKFIPNPDEEMKPMPFLSLKGKAIVDSEIHTQQRIILVNNLEKPASERSITIITCKNWKPGKNKPPPKPAILVDLWQTVERISRSEEPTLVLCYDGVTSCGLYLALSFLLERMGLERECDVCLAIRAIRRSRPDFCKSIEQYSYLYDAAEVYNDCFEIYANFM